MCGSSLITTFHSQADFISILMTQMIISVFVWDLLMISETILSILKDLMRKNDNIYIFYQRTLELLWKHRIRPYSERFTYNSKK